MAISTEATATSAMATASTPPAPTAPAATARTKRYSLADLEHVAQPWDDTRYEIIDGELFVSTQPSLTHQYIGDNVVTQLRAWDASHAHGFVFSAPGVIFADDDNAAPDIVWLSKERLRTVIGDDGKLHGAPEIVMEVLSPGAKNERRDRDVKLKLYSRRGVDEYWILDPALQRVEVYRRDQEDPSLLRLAAALSPEDTLDSPLLPGFTVQVAALFLTF